MPSLPTIPQKCYRDGGGDAGAQPDAPQGLRAAAPGGRVQGGRVDAEWMRARACALEGLVGGSSAGALLISEENMDIGCMSTAKLVH